MHTDKLKANARIIADYKATIEGQPELTKAEKAKLKRQYTRVPIVSRHGIYLLPRGEGDEEKFVRVFRKVWAGLPLYARRRLLKSWRETRAQLGGVTVVPQIQVLCDWSGHEDQDRNATKAGDTTGNTYGMVYNHQIRFWAPAVDAMPDDILAVLIAHELAHLVCPEADEEDIQWRNWVDFGCPDSVADLGELEPSLDRWLDETG